MLRNEDIINVFDVERILGDLPIDIIKENIKSQIDDPLSYSINQCEQVYETLQEAMDEFGHIDEYKNEIYEIKDDFSAFVITEINNKFNLGVDLDNLSDYEIHDLAEKCYEFFIVDLRNALTRFILNYICMNKSSIAEIFSDEYKRKDVTTTNMKKITKNREDIIILSNIISVVYYILDMDHAPEDFIELAIEPGEYVGETIRDAVMSFKLAGDFVYPILNELKYAHNDNIDEIASTLVLDLKDMIPEGDLVSYLDEE